MKFNVIRFYKDYQVDHADRGSKHCRAGWVNIHCPFCHGNDYHLGVNVSTGAVKCWKCGTHSMTEVIRRILDCNFQTANDLIESYSEGSSRPVYSSPETELRERKAVCALPFGTEPMTQRHVEYLERRGFNAEVLERVWGLRGTGNIGDYKFRIIAPIYFDSILVSYQGRDITEKAPLRYKACSKQDEVLDHQTVVYGLDLVKGGTCVIVEGIADAWRFGPGAVSCFGIAFTLAQVNLIASRFKSVFILFDAEEEAQKQARELAILLNAKGVEVEILDISETEPNELIDPSKGIDPGNLKQEVADQIMKELELWQK